MLGAHLWLKVLESLRFSAMLRWWGFMLGAHLRLKVLESLETVETPVGFLDSGIRLYVLALLNDGALMGGRLNNNIRLPIGIE